MKTIPIMFEQECTHLEGTLGILNPDVKKVLKNIDAKKINKSLKEFSMNLSSVFENVEFIGSYELETIQLGIEISAEGGVSLIANSKAQANSTISLTYKRSRKE